MQLLTRETDQINLVRFLALYYLARKRSDNLDGVKGSDIIKDLKLAFANQKDWHDVVDKTLRQSTVMVLSGHIASDKKGNYSITDYGIKSMDRLKLLYSSSPLAILQESLMRLSDICDAQSAEIVNEQEIVNPVVPIKKNFKNGGI